MDHLRDWLLHPRRTRTARRRLARALEEDAKFRRTRDPIENEESTPPNDEEIRLRAVWMAESYPLSFADLLVDSVSQLTRDNPTVIGEAPGVQLEQALRSGRSGWIPLGTFVRPGHHRFVGSSPIEVPLPRDVDYGHGSLHFMLPSHIVLVSCFVLDEPGSRRVERALRANYVSHTVRSGRVLVTKTPANQKRDAVTTTRSQQLSEMAKFFHREAAGLFSNAGRDLPAVEFWTTKQRKPFDDNQRRSIHDFIQLLGWVTWIDVWQGPENLTVKEAPVRSDDYWTLPANRQIVAREHEIFPRDDLAMYGGRSNEAFVNRLQDHIAPLVAALAVAETFRFYDSEVVASRRRLRDAQKQALHRRVRELLTFRIGCCSSMRTWMRFLGMSNVGRTACCRCYKAKRSISSAGCHRPLLGRRTLAPTWQVAICSHGFDVVWPDSAGSAILSPKERHRDQARHCLEHWLTRSPAALSTRLTDRAR